MKYIEDEYEYDEEYERDDDKYIKRMDDWQECCEILNNLLDSISKEEKDYFLKQYERLKRYISNDELYFHLEDNYKELEHFGDKFETKNFDDIYESFKSYIISKLQVEKLDTRDCCGILDKLGENFKCDKDIFLQILKIYASDFSYDHDGWPLKKDFDYIFEHADAKIKDNPEVFLSLLKNYREYGDTEVTDDLECDEIEILKYTSDNLKKDPEFILEALRRNSYALEYADKELFSNKEFMINALDIDVMSYKYAEEIKSDNEYALNLIKKGIWCKEFENNEEYFDERKKYYKNKFGEMMEGEINFFYSDLSNPNEALKETCSEILNNMTNEEKNNIPEKIYKEMLKYSVEFKAKEARNLKVEISKLKEQKERGIEE